MRRRWSAELTVIRLPKTLTQPGSWTMEAKHESQKRCFARTIGAKQAKDVARLDCQGRVVQRNLPILINFGEMFGLNNQR